MGAHVERPSAERTTPPPASGAEAEPIAGSGAGAPPPAGIGETEDPVGRENTYGGAPPVDPVASARAVIPDARSAKGFVSSLFDFSFRTFIFPRVVQLIYLIGVILISLGAVLTFLAMARTGAAGFVAGLVVAIVGWFIFIVFFRILMEIYLVFFSIRDHVAAIDRRQQ